MNNVSMESNRKYFVNSSSGIRNPNDSPQQVRYVSPGLISKTSQGQRPTPAVMSTAIGSPRFQKPQPNNSNRTWIPIQNTHNDQEQLQQRNLQFVSSPSNHEPNVYRSRNSLSKNINTPQPPENLDQQLPVPQRQNDPPQNIYSNYKAQINKPILRGPCFSHHMAKVDGPIQVLGNSNSPTQKEDSDARVGKLLRTNVAHPLATAWKSPSLGKLDNFITQVKQKQVSTEEADEQSTTTSTGGMQVVTTEFKFAQHRSLSPPLMPRKYYITEAVQSLTNTCPMAAEFKENINQNYQSLRLVQGLTSPTYVDIEKRKVDLGQYPSKYKFRKTIVFDLDETLVHCSAEYAKNADMHLEIHFPTGEEVSASIFVRPFAIQILKQLSRLCEVIVFTASHSCYATKVVKALDPTGEMITRLLDRDSCIQTKEGVYVKDIRVIGRELKDIVLVDNALYSFGFQISNGIPIVSYYEGKTDQQLLALYSFLINEILPARDVRPVLTRYFKFFDWGNYLSGREAVSQLYEL